MSESRDTVTTGPESGALPDGSIPMLTEIIRFAGEASDASAPLPASLEQVEWAGLAERVRDDVLARLMQHSDQMLAAELRSSLSLVLDRTLRQLGDELHESMSQLVRDLVARAVADEITRLHDEIERRDGQRGTGRA